MKLKGKKVCWFFDEKLHPRSTRCGFHGGKIVSVVRLKSDVIKHIKVQTYSWGEIKIMPHEVNNKRCGGIVYRGKLIPMV